MTLFFRKPGVPLDSNVCEPALKKGILDRKNALFYKTEDGACVGDLHMSLIYTAELTGSPLLTTSPSSKRTPRGGAAPDRWMPWNHRQTIAEGDAASS
jgi:hypothetical protein